MAYPPKNIVKMVKENERIANACSIVKEFKKHAIDVNWHAKDYVISASHDSNLTRAKVSTKDDPLLSGTRAAGYQAVKAARRERLKELYEREAIAYENELNALGLSLMKLRD
mmetsp:Transcript_26788/g.49216  ORF Transcript_26788/g.49216 Transcript_26788/m.49216 type:complete len:112 (-) Transcript_26788:1529-1864(-)